MISLRSCAGFGVAVFLLTSCSHLHPWATDRDIEGTYDQVFQATLETLEARQFPIEKANLDEGRIVTGRRPVRAIESRRRVEKARARIRPDGAGTAEVTFFLTFMDQSGSVRPPEPDDDHREVDVAASNALSSSAIYDEYLDAVEERVRELNEGS